MDYPGYTQRDDGVKLFLDIETAALPNIKDPPPKFLEKGIRDDFKSDTVDKYIAQNREKWTDKAALDWRKGRVIAYGCWEDGASDNVSIWTGENIREAELLTSLWNGNWPSLDVVGFNIRGFDIPFLIGRSAVNGIVPPQFKLARFRRDLGIIDLMDVLSFDGAFDLTGWSLAYYCEYFGLETQPYGEGADVAEWYAEGNWDEIRKHLEADVLMTRDLYYFACGAFHI